MRDETKEEGITNRDSYGTRSSLGDTLLLPMVAARYRQHRRRGGLRSLGRKTQALSHDGMGPRS
jgi:hypothetical protein